MSFTIASFNDFKMGSDNSGCLLLLDHLFLPAGEYNMDKAPERLLILLQDRQGIRMQAYAYGSRLAEYRALRRNSIVCVESFELKRKESDEEPFYPDAVKDCYGSISECAVIREFGPTDGEVYSLDEVKTYQGRFTLTLTAIEEQGNAPSCGDYVNSFWKTLDGRLVHIAAYNDLIPLLTKLATGETYIISNAKPWLKVGSSVRLSQICDYNFSLGTETEILRA